MNSDWTWPTDFIIPERYFYIFFFSEDSVPVEIMKILYKLFRLYFPRSDNIFGSGRTHVAERRVMTGGSLVSLRRATQERVPGERFERVTVALFAFRRSFSGPLLPDNFVLCQNIDSGQAPGKTATKETSREVFP